MKRDIYIAFLCAKYIGMTMEQVNQLEDKHKEYYVQQIEAYLESEAPAALQPIRVRTK